MAKTHFTENEHDTLIGSLIGVSKTEFTKIYNDIFPRLTVTEGTALRYAYKALNASKNNLSRLFNEWQGVHINLLSEARTEGEMRFVSYADCCFESSINHLAHTS